LKPLVNISSQECTKCYACVRICPVKAIYVSTGGGFPELVPGRCIGCGSCITICNTRAVSYRSSLEEAKQLLGSGEKIAVLLSPSISAEFDDISDHRKFVTMIKALGITWVNEVSFAVDMIAYRYLSLLNDFKGRYYITANDPIVVSYIEKYHPSCKNKFL